MTYLTDGTIVREVTPDDATIPGWKTATKKEFSAYIKKVDKAEAARQKAYDKASETWVLAYQDAVEASARGQATDDQIETLLNPEASFAAAVDAAS